MSERQPSRWPDIGGYRYIRELGHGGFADVYLYHDLATDRDVAVKVLHTEAAGPEAVARLNKEASAMSQLSQHPHIVTVFGPGVADDGRPYLVMEYYPGPALSKGLRQSPKSLAYSLKTGIQLAGALESAHRMRVPDSRSRGMLHRDIKPANILVDRLGRPVLGDFGIAMSDAEAQRGGAQGMSVPWSPPEMFDRNPRPSKQSDVWGLAATVYALLTGRAPFEIPGGDNRNHAMIDRIRNEPYRRLGRDDTSLLSLDQVLSTAMAKKPKARYLTMAHFGVALRAIEEELGLPPTAMEVLDDSSLANPTDLDSGLTTLEQINPINPAGSPPSSPGQPATGLTGGASRTLSAAEGADSAPSGGPGPSTGPRPSPPPAAAEPDRPVEPDRQTGPDRRTGGAAWPSARLAPAPPTQNQPDAASPRPGGAGEESGDTVLRDGEIPLAVEPTVLSPGADDAPPAIGPSVERTSPDGSLPAGPGPSDGPADAGAGPGPAARPPRRIAWRVVAAAVAVVVVAALIALLVLTGKPPHSGPATGGSASGSFRPENPVVVVPPTPVDLNGTVDPARGVVVFTWTNPDPQDGDQYRWTVEGSSTPNITDKPQATVPLAPGEFVCINVRLIRSGVGSEEVQKCAM